jgi:hypothetical protein
MTRDRDALLDRLAREAPPSEVALERLRVRRASKARTARIRAGALGGFVAIAVVAGALFGATRHTTGARTHDGGSNPSVPLVAQPGQYYYSSFEFWDASANSALTHPSYTDTLWIGPDGSGRNVGNGGGLANRDQTFAAGELKFLDLSADPNSAIQQLIDRGSSTGASPNPIATSSPGRSQETTSLLRTLQDLLTVGADVYLTPEQTAAVFDGAQSIEGVTTQEGVADPLGRPATRLGFVIDYGYGAGDRVDWYFDAQTKQFMGQVWVNTGSNQVHSAMLVVTAGIADSTTDPPSSDASYVPTGNTTPDFATG